MYPNGNPHIMQHRLHMEACLINKVCEILVETGQNDKRFQWGDTIRYSPAEIKKILEDHTEELEGCLTGEQGVKVGECNTDYCEIIMDQDDQGKEHPADPDLDSEPEAK